jgi:hypothetical protein
MPEPKYCEDCGDEVETRRTRCPNCGKLVCSWCYHHIHGVLAGVYAEDGLSNNACTGLATTSPEEESRNQALGQLLRGLANYASR